ncbi:MAG: histidinol-phosphate aminotransferase family protein, partial [Paraprevotella sp.]|nr:histidinol-phosphate aminotransferase family protein [Paraprevotella sp.]
VLRVIALLDNCELKGLPLEGERWYEIDDAQDLDIAETLFAEENKLQLYHKRYGGYWRFPTMKDFCYLVNPYYPPRKMREELKANFDTLLTEYPSGMHVNTLLMAKNFGLKQDYVVVGNGAAELIKSLMEQSDDCVGVTYPTFEEYPNRLPEHRKITFVPNNEDFRYTADELINFFSGTGIHTLLLINPDNPSGNFISTSGIQKLLAWSKAQNIRLIVDESFVDFATDGRAHTLLKNEVMEQNPHLVVVKSISKSYGVPGLRLGLIASANTELISRTRKDVSIWNINSFAEFYMQIYSKYEQKYDVACQKIASERDRFFEALKRIDFLRIIPSQANYFLCEVISKFTSHELSDLLLRQHNILIKDCGTKSAFHGRNYIRIAVRDRADNDTLIQILNEIDK